LFLSLTLQNVLDNKEVFVNPVKVADNHPPLDDLDLDEDEAQAARAVAVEDRDGNLLLSEVFAKRMQLSRPAPPRASLKKGEANYIFEQKVFG
jgi:hypothetical protein